MKRLIGWGVRLYPARWRARYGEEFAALVEDSGARWGDVWDVFRGAMLMRLTSLKFAVIVAVFAAAGMVGMGVWSVTLPDQYISTSVLRVESKGDQTAAQQELMRAQQSALSRASLRGIIDRQKLYSEELKTAPLEGVIQQMRNKAIRIQRVESRNGGVMFAISFSYSDRAAAQQTVRELVTALNGATALEVLDPASDPMGPSGPNRVAMVATGLAAGLVVGLLCAGLWALVRRGKAWSVKRVGGFAAGGMVLGVTVAILMPNEYYSMAVLRAPDRSAVQAALEKALDTDSLAQIVRKYGLYQREQARKPIQDAVQKMRQKDIRVQTIQAVHGIGAGTAFTVSFHYTDAAIAQQVTRDLMTEIMKQYGGGNAVEVLDPASYPQKPSSPNRVQIAGLGMVGGLLLGLASTRFRRPSPAAA